MYPDGSKFNRELKQNSSNSLLKNNKTKITLLFILARPSGAVATRSKSAAMRAAHLRSVTQLSAWSSNGSWPSQRVARSPRPGRNLGLGRERGPSRHPAAPRVNLSRPTRSDGRPSISREQNGDDGHHKTLTPFPFLLLSLSHRTLHGGSQGGHQRR